MRRLIYALTRVALVFILFLPAMLWAQSSNRVVVYYTNWSQYRPGECKFTPQNIQAQYMTHLNYAFAKIDTNNKVQPVEWNDILDYAPGMYKQVNDIKLQYPHLKTLISIGGWTLSDAFPRMASSAASRSTFIQSAIQYARTHNFDGIDLDWEYPGFAEHSGTPQDKVNFTSLLREFRQAINAENLPSGKSRLLLTIAAPAGESNFNNMELAHIHAYLDWINLMTYDMHGSWDAYTGVNSPLMHDSVPNGKFYIDYTVRAYLAAGVPADKLVLGMPTYGRSYGTASSNLPNSPLTSPWNANPPKGRCTGEAGFISFYEMNELLNNNTYTSAWDANTETPYAYDGNGNWISYDNEVSIGRKLEYLKNKNLGGAMVWAMDLDDKYALIGQIANTLRGVNPPAPAPSPVPTPTPAPTPTPEPTPVPVPGAPMTQVLSPEIKIELSYDSQWSSGATMKALITNTSASKSFSQIQIKANVSSGINMWSMDPVSKTAQDMTVQLPSWQSGLASGKSHAFGFTISPNLVPSFVLVNAVELDPPAPPPPAPAPSPSPSPVPSPNPGQGSMTQVLANGLTLYLKIDSQWGTTESWAGASVSATLKNTTASTTFSPLRMAADMGAGLSIWSMEAVSKSSTETVVQLPSWQKGLKPGESFTFGFNISPIRIPGFILK